MFRSTSSSLRASVSLPSTLSTILLPSYRSFSAIVPPPSSLELSNSVSHPSQDQPTGLLKFLNQHIKAAGPISMPIFTNFCLQHPVLGYYSRTDRLDRADPFGCKGDFITSPEISQVFGELVAIWFISRWQAAGSPRPARIIELGPGRGTLMADITRTFNSVKAFKGALGSVHLVENSPFMRDLQRQKLCQGHLEGKVHWYDRIEQVPRAESEWTMIIAHEFFDALPVHVFQNTEMGFREVLVDIDDRAPVSAAHKPLRLVLSPGPTLASQTLLTDAHRGIPVGAKLELSPSSTQVAGQMARILESASSVETGGTGLVVDYGDDHHFGYSLRGFYRHRIVDPLSKPGLTDITANVDFASLKRAMNPHVSTYGPITQRNFLLSMGIEVRTKQLNKALLSASERLVSSMGMGEQYKFLGFESRTCGGGREEVYPFPDSSLRLSGSQ